MTKSSQLTCPKSHKWEVPVLGAPISLIPKLFSFPLSQWASNLRNITQKAWLLGPPLKFLILGWHLRICISKRSPGDAEAAIQSCMYHTFRTAALYSMQSAGRSEFPIFANIQADVTEVVDGQSPPNALYRAFPARGSQSLGPRWEGCPGFPGDRWAQLSLLIECPFELGSL